MNTKDYFNNNDLKNNNWQDRTYINNQKDYKSKYYKYKKKYLDLKAGSGIVEEFKTMPLLSFGTAQGTIDTLKDRIKQALETGYRHLDIKERYAGLLKISVDVYLDAIKQSIQESGIPRKELWITWNGNNIERIIELLNCDYIDTLIGNNLEELNLLKDRGIIKNIAVENIYNFEEIVRLKERYRINTLQIQGHIKNEELIEKCNSIGIKVQLYGIMSSFKNYLFDNFDVFDDPNIQYVYQNIVSYYMFKYMKNKGNVIVVSSVNGDSIPVNMELYNKIISGSINNETIDIERIETILKKIGDKMPDMGFGTLY